MITRLVPRLLPALLLSLPSKLALAQTMFGPRPGTAPAPAPDGVMAALLRKQAEFYTALTKTLAATLNDPAAATTLAGLALAYGVIHAIGPGHGKAVIAAYLVASENAARRGIALAFAAAGVQALIALLIVGVVALAFSGTAADMMRAGFWVEKLGYGIIIALGLALVWRKGRALLNPQAVACGPGCGHEHGPPAEGGSWRQMALTALGAGIRPCTGAVTLLVFSLTLGRPLMGVLAVMAMALGTAIGTSAFALLAVKAKVLSLNIISGRGQRLAKLGLAIELLAGLLLAALGAALLAGAMAGGM